MHNKLKRQKHKRIMTDERLTNIKLWTGELLSVVQYKYD